MAAKTHRAPARRGKTPVAPQAILSPAVRFGFVTPMPRKPQSEDSILRKIADRARLFHEPSGPSVTLGIGDDAALFRPKPGQETILTSDWFLEGTHFLRQKHSPDAVGWKCLARAVSDVAAMGGTPRCFLLSLALPESHTGAWLDRFLAGLGRASRKFQCGMAGGDTTRRDEVLINVTVVGEVRVGCAALRSGARPGDILHVSGCLGEAEFGLLILRRYREKAVSRNPAVRKHLYPEPRLALGQWLVKNGLASAMMDLSDGLSGDLPRLCAASRAGVLLKQSKIPRLHVLDTALNHHPDSLQLALHGGDDYELLFTVPPRKVRRLPKTFQGVPLTAIGEITRRRELLILKENGDAMQLKPRGWDPFRKKL
jgi:thiamine-monophosphate kinase